MRQRGYRARNAVDRTGKRYGRLTVIHRAPDRIGDSNAQWLCRCDCGNEIVVGGSRLAKRKEGCGCETPSNFKDLTGGVFGRLTVISRFVDASRNTKWLCQCSCGNQKVAWGETLRRGDAQSCGCLKRERCSASGKISNRKHGLRNHPLYRIWGGMKVRCLDPRCKAYPNYGGRGISVCEEWMNPETFILWGIANGWSKGLSIDRIDNNGNYDPSNCRFTSSRVQNRNRRTNRYLDIDGERRIIAEWAEISGNSQQVITRRVQTGWPIRDAVFTPPTVFHL